MLAYEYKYYGCSIGQDNSDISSPCKSNVKVSGAGVAGRTGRRWRAEVTVAQAASLLYRGVLEGAVARGRAGLKTYTPPDTTRLRLVSHIAKTYCLLSISWPVLLTAVCSHGNPKDNCQQDCWLDNLCYWNVIYGGRASSSLCWAGVWEHFIVLTVCQISISTTQTV